MIHTGDCLDVMATLEADTFDAIVTDPPYGLEFMGKEWDRLWTEQGGKTWAWGNHGGLKAPAYKAGVQAQAWHQRWAEAACRVAKPSAYLLAFGGTRTVHRLTVALEDAGWIIRDLLVWAYASGFPKSKASLKPAWEPIVMARKPGPLRMLAIDECRIPLASGETGESVYNGPTGPGFSMDGTRTLGAIQVTGNDAGRWPANVILTDPIFDGGWDGVVGGGEAAGSKPFDWTDAAERASFPVGREASVFYDDSGTYSRFFQLRGESCDWCGAPTVGRSSRLSSGAGGSALGDAATLIAGRPASIDQPTASPPTSGTETTSWLDDDESTPSTRRSRQPGTSPASGRPSSSARSPDAASRGTAITTTMGDLSMCATCAEAITSAITSPSRDYPWAFLIPKADRSDREPVLGGLPEQLREGKYGTVQDARPHTPEGYVYDRKPRANVHPTVKPTDLMRHLVRLVTPAGGLVLDPFLGSGTTALACEMEGFGWVGIEKEPEYVAIAEARLNGTQRGLGLVG